MSSRAEHFFRSISKISKKHFFCVAGVDAFVVVARDSVLQRAATNKLLQMELRLTAKYTRLDILSRNPVASLIHENLRRSKCYLFKSFMAFLPPSTCIRFTQIYVRRGPKFGNRNT